MGKENGLLGWLFKPSSDYVLGSENWRFLWTLQIGSYILKGMILGGKIESVKNVVQGQLMSLEGRIFSVLQKNQSKSNTTGSYIAKFPFKKSINDEHKKKISEANKLRWAERKEKNNI